MKFVSFLDRLLRRKGKWIRLADGKQQCNRCGKKFVICVFPYSRTYYCPCCGALNYDPEHDYKSTYIS